MRNQGSGVTVGFRENRTIDNEYICTDFRYTTKYNFRHIM